MQEKNSSHRKLYRNVCIVIVLTRSQYLCIASTKAQNTCCQVPNIGYLHDILESSEHKHIGEEMFLKL